MTQSSITSPTFEELLALSAQFHKHVCPRQVLGVRIGMAAGQWLGLALPQTNKRLLTIAETDGCGVDGISVATGCWVGRRTLHIMDSGLFNKRVIRGQERIISELMPDIVAV